MAVEPLVETSRELYKKGVDISSETRRFMEETDSLVHNAETCFIQGILSSHRAMMDSRDRVLSKIFNGFTTGKISAEEADHAQILVDSYRKEWEKEAIKKTEEACRCQWRK